MSFSPHLLNIINMKKILFAALLSSTSFSTIAAFYNGNDLIDWDGSRKRVINESATPNDLVMAGMFRGFVVSTFNATLNTRTCADDKTTINQLEDVVSLYLVNHPELRTKSSSLLAADALSNAFPCKK